MPTHCPFFFEKPEQKPLCPSETILSKLFLLILILQQHIPADPVGIAILSDTEHEVQSYFPISTMVSSMSSVRSWMSRFLALYGLAVALIKADIAPTGSGSPDSLKAFKPPWWIIRCSRR